MKVSCLLLVLFFIQPPTIHAAVVVSEFLPNPVGDDLQGEWIELWNDGEESVALDGWTLSDTFGTTKSYLLHNIEIDAGQYVLLSRAITGITLNNDKEQVRLLDPTGNEFLSSQISPISEGVSYSIFPDGWFASTPTPAERNQRMNEPSPTPNPSPTLLPSPSTQPSPSPPIASLSAQLQLTEIRACGDGTEWVEVLNLSDRSNSGIGWSIRDAAGNTVKLDDMQIQQDEYAAIDLQKTILNNSGDTVSLFYNDTKKETVSYSLCNALMSYSKGEDDEWNEAQPTKGMKNKTSDLYELQQDVTSKITPTPTAISSFIPQVMPMQYALPMFYTSTQEEKVFRKKKGRVSLTEAPIEQVLTLLLASIGMPLSISRIIMMKS